MNHQSEINQTSMAASYSEGIIAYDKGLDEESNPYGMGELLERSAWHGGWHDRRREVEKSEVTERIRGALGELC